VLGPHPGTAFAIMDARCVLIEGGFHGATNHVARSQAALEPRKLKDCRAFYERWSSEVFTFCSLLLGERQPAELCTEQVFSLFFQSAGCQFTGYSEIPVRLLRFACDIAEVRCHRHPQGNIKSRAQALLALAFRDRAAFILVSVLRLKSSAAAVALGIDREELRRRWLNAALELRHLWPNPNEMQLRTEGEI
jgi:hypothetical protein